MRFGGGCGASRGGYGSRLEGRMMDMYESVGGLLLTVRCEVVESQRPVAEGKFGTREMRPQSKEGATMSDDGRLRESGRLCSVRPPNKVRLSTPPLSIDYSHTTKTTTKMHSLRLITCQIISSLPHDFTVSRLDVLICSSRPKSVVVSPRKAFSNAVNATTPHLRLAAGPMRSGELCCSA